MDSCNGLVCLKINIIVKTRKVVYTYHYYSILNPLTREYKEIRRPERSYDVAYGFGYDSNIDDYKLVIVSGYGCFRIYIYTLRSDSWTSIQCAVGYKSRTGEGTRGVCFNERLDWLGRIATQETSSHVIVCFDICNETVVDIPLPENVMPPTYYHGEIYANLGVWGDNIIFV